MDLMNFCMIETFAISFVEFGWFISLSCYLSFMFKVSESLALSFSGCGFLGIYHFGSVNCLRKHGRQLLKNCSKVAGASAGSLVAALLVVCPEKIDVRIDLISYLLVKYLFVSFYFGQFLFRMQ